MADKQGYYWDLDECAWVRCAAAAATVEVPEQPTAVDAEREADVRSG